MAFEKGNKLAGSRKGKPNKVTADLRAMIEGALSDVGGRKYLAEQAVSNPSAFLTLVGKTLPKEVTGDLTGNFSHTLTVAWGKGG